MIAGIWLRNGGVFSAGLPVEFPAVHNDTSQSGAMTADKFGSGVDHDVRPELNGPDQEGGAKGVVNDQGQAMGMGNLRDDFNVGDIAVGVTRNFQVDGLGIGTDGGGDGLQVVGVHKGGFHPELGQCMSQQVIAAAIDGLLGHNVTAGLGQGLDRIADGRCARGSGQGCHAAFQGRNALFQHVLSGIGQPAVDIPSVSKPKSGGGVDRIAEHIAGGLVDGYRPCVGGGVGLLLTHMELKGFKLIAHGKYPLSLS